MSWLELRVPPAVVAAVHGAGMWALSRTAEGTLEPSSARRMVTGALALLAFSIVVTAILQFRAAGTTVDPRTPSAATTVVTEGIYAVTRNPIYLAFALMLTAWCVHLGSPLSLTLLPVFVLYLTRFQILPEERMLSQRFGDEYEEYRRRVRRWI